MVIWIWSFVIGSALPAAAQWQTQTFPIKAGWNAIYAHVDASHAALGDVVPTTVEEVWLWNPSPLLLQYIDSPQLPIDTGSSWTSWKRNFQTQDQLERFIGNAAYLVKASADTTLSLKGKPVQPRYHWTSKGQNFIGFSTPVTPATFFENFLGPAPDLLNNAQVFKYTGGNLGPSNPQRVFNLRDEPVKRGQAYWIRSPGTFNRYFGPFELDLQNSTGAHFGAGGGQYRCRLKNLTTANLTVTVNVLASEAAPAGEKTISGTPPILLRGPLNITNLTYGYTNLNAGPQNWTLTPAGEEGSNIEVVLGVNRAALTGNAGDLHAGLLRFTDSSGFSQVDIGVSAEVASTAGLWVGDANITQVRHDLSFFRKLNTGEVELDTDGVAIVSSRRVDFGSVARPFPLRLIIHTGANGAARLLQRVYYGLDAGELPMLASKESLLNQEHLGVARRISASHLPFSEANNPWALAGTFGAGQTLTNQLVLGYNDQAANPFVRTYHPDHDNRNATFDAFVAQGVESYGIVRDVSLLLVAPANDFNGLTSGSRTLVGNYGEVITLQGKGSESKQYAVQGSVTLNRITDIPNLVTTAP